MVDWQGQQRPAAAGHWIVELDGLVGAWDGQATKAADRLAAAGLAGQVSVLRNLGADGLLLVDVSAELPTQAAYATLQRLPGFRNAEPDFIVSIDATPNDPSFGQLYGMNNTGQTVNGDPGTADADIDAVEAWNDVTGSSDVVIGVIDTGIDYTHPDLIGNIWTNPGEIPGNSIDDDLNGYVDDVHGYDFLNLDGDPTDDRGHGTHVAGTIGAVGNNGIGVAGVNWDVSLMALKFLGADGTGPTSAAAAAVNYVNMMSDRGFNIRATNNSWGGGGYDPFMLNAIAGNRDRDILFVAAAGNSASNNDVTPHYPSSYNLENVIAVAATNNDDNLASFSSYGATSVDLAAPGVNILSSVPGGFYSYYNGTSMATPHVTGAVALAFAEKPDATYSEVRNAILAGVDLKPSLTGKMTTGGRLNLVGMLDQLGLFVSSTTPAVGSTIATNPTDFVVNLTDPYISGTVQATDLTVNGIAADSFALTDADTITFQYNSSPVTTQGLQSMAMAASAVLRTGDSAPLHAFAANFRYDISPITVVATLPSDGAAESLPMSDFEVTFSEPYLASSIDAGDLVLSHGSVTGFTLIDADTVQFHINLTTEGQIDVAIAAGAVTDLFGNSGPGYSGNFTADVSTLAFPSTLTRVLPAGSLVYRSSYAGSVALVGDSDSFTIQLDPGQTLTVTAIPDATLQPRIDISGPGVSTSATSPAPASPAVAQTVSLSGGSYTITVSGLAGTTGNYTLTLTLNAAVESEQFVGPADDTYLTAQDLSGAFTSLGGSGSIAAVIGTGDYSLPDEIEPNDALLTANDATTNFATYAGNLYHLGLKGTISAAGDQDWFNIGQLQVGDVLTITVLGVPSSRGTLSDPVLWLYRGPASDPEFVLINDNDGPGNDALLYRLVITATDTYYINSPRYDGITGTYDIGIYLENAAAAPLTGGSFTTETESNGSAATANNASTSWRAVQYASPTSGAVTGGDTDFYRYQFTAGSLVTIHAASADGLRPRVSLLDAGGAVIASEDGTSTGPTTDSAVYAYLIPSTGTYYVEVQSALGTGTYDLNVYLSSTTPPPAPTATFDTYAFSLTAGETVTLAAKGLGGSSPNLGLLNSAGTLVALGSIGSTNLDQVIGNYLATASGTYYARLGPNNPFDYNLIVTRNATFDTQPNASLATAQVLAPASQVLGALDGTGDRYYWLNLLVGQPLTLSTTTPGDATGQFTNSVNPAIDLYSPSGVIVAGDDNSAPDGRNAQLVYIPPSSGSYRVRVRAAAGQGEFVLNAAGAVGSLPSTVAGRRIFYNQSGTASPLRYDGNNASINSNDDNAIATDKVAYLPGAGPATFANVTGYSKGINGIMIDIAGAHGTITTADFVFRVGNNNSPSTWATAPNPSAMSVRVGAGTSGSDRVEFIWANNAIQKQWLQVVTLAGANTGLAQLPGYTAGYGDVFYFGNAVGDSGLGDTATLASVNATDELGARNNPASLLSNIPITNLYDYNRDGAVNATDQLISRNNPAGLANATRYLNLAAGSPPNAPEGDGGAGQGEDAGVASALAAPAGGTTSTSPNWLANSLSAASVDSGSTAEALTQIVAEDDSADGSQEEDDSLDALLAEMGLA